MDLQQREHLKSRYGYTWRGIRRSADREHALAGSEALVVDVGSGEVLAVFRNYVRTGFTRNVAEGIWWLNAVSCSNVPKAYQDNLGQQLYGFLSRVLRPVSHTK